MTVTQAGDRMPAVEIQDLAAVARVQPDALPVGHLDGILRKHLRQVAGESLGRHSCQRCRHLNCLPSLSLLSAVSWFRAPQVHPGAGVVRPVVSARPNKRFIHCMAPPAAPLLRLSTTDMTAMELPLVTALKFE